MDQALATKAEAFTLEPPTGHIEDFDFLMGEWRVHHRRLVGRLVGSTTWEEFEGQLTTWKIMGGLGNVDDCVINLPAGPYPAAALRTFDPERRLWSIFWVDSRVAKMDPPQVGGFDGAHGTFYGEDVHDGIPVGVRFAWTVEDDDHCLWEQAFTTDNGASWETNWIMRLERAE